ncbi:MAG: hypothetical protein GY853_01480 [PVC group bacterium]|nr:hypothetical protein [PVC group bacterium]
MSVEKMLKVALCKNDEKQITVQRDLIEEAIDKIEQFKASISNKPELEDVLAEIRKIDLRLDEDGDTFYQKRLKEVLSKYFI